MNPFFFNLGRARGPLAVGDAVLAPEDVFVLLGESLDLGYFAAQPRNLNLGYFAAEGRVALLGPGPRFAREIVLKETS